MKDLKKFAELAGIELTAEEESDFQQELSQILKAFEVIEAYKGRENPPVQATSENRFRKDVVESWSVRKEALANSPQLTGNLVKVPPVL